MMELIGRLSEFTEIDSLFAITNEQALNFKEKGEYRFLSIAPLPEKDEEKCFWEQIIYKVAPFIKFNRLSKEKPYAYFEKNEATAYYLAAIFTENEQKWIYCNSCNQWINISINPKNKEKIIFSEGAAYFYIKINKKDFEKDKVSKQLSLEWERRKYKQKKLPEIYKSTEKTKKIEIEKLKNIEIQQKIQNSEDIINNYQLERLNNQEITNNRKELMAEKDENGEKMQKDNRIQRKLQWKLITLKELIFENEILEKRCINYENKAELLEKENQTYKAQNEVLNQEKEIYKAQNEFLNQENQTYKAQNEVLNQEKETYKAQNEVLNQENQTYKTQLKSLTEEIKKLRENKILNYPLIFDRKKAGIPNIGNTCYLNSLLQVFASNNEFCEKIRPLTYELFSTLSSLLVSIRDPTTNTIWEFVMAFKSRFNDEFPWLGDLTQQDSKEVLLMLIGRLSDFTNIEPLFIISYKQILNCHDCNYKAKATETNTFITVPINKFSSIQEFITDIKKPKKFIGDGSQLYCEKCNKQQDMTVEYEEIIWPSTVTFYLSSKNGRIRINKELDIEGTIYRWYGLICHYGDSWSGHYLAYTWDTNNWTEYNDSKTANRCSRSIDVANGYLAFYARAGNPK
ncbi:unnamed protein product [Blepharisma stoltei]|uniref:USP domain-containing protein n=1 Tax=Blepharisma stoltei TaxID=1481888 RepID=A0AAU9IRS8_9CILI|nr:unnamed protein product [Blepharisma stoltei]